MSQFWIGYYSGIATLCGVTALVYLLSAGKRT